MASRIPPEQRSKALQHYYNNLDAKRAMNRQRAKEYYYRDKAAKLAKNKAFKEANPEKFAEVKRLSNLKYYRRTKCRFFYRRALLISSRATNHGIDAEELGAHLSRAWYNQRGRCAYTGQKLGRDAQVDHKTPTSKGGTNHPTNLHWVTPQANSCKGSMTHEQFLGIATDIVAYIALKRPSTPSGKGVSSDPPHPPRGTDTPSKKRASFPRFSSVDRPPRKK
jgi:5-methylcytosine-specific restriction endonuclease McrA